MTCTGWGEVRLTPRGLRHSLDMPRDIHDSNIRPPQSNGRIQSLSKRACSTRGRFRSTPEVGLFAKSPPIPSRFTSGGPVQLEDVPQMLRGVLDVDARAGRHGPSHESPARKRLVSLPPCTVQIRSATTPPDSRGPSTTQYLAAVRKPPPGLRL